MSEQNRIHMSDGLEQVVGQLRDLEGQFPSEAEMQARSGPNAGIARPYDEVMRDGASLVRRQFAALDTDLQAAEALMSAAIAEQREVESDAVAMLDKILAELDGTSDAVNPGGHGSPPAGTQPGLGGKPSGYKTPAQPGTGQQPGLGGKPSGY